MADHISSRISPVFRRLMPEIEHNPAASAPVSMNLAANMLGLDNAATPLGLKAMEQLQKTNLQPAVARTPWGRNFAIGLRAISAGIKISARGFWARRWRFAHREGLAERVTSPPRFALPPRGGLLVAGCAESEDMPPAPSALPPGVGRSRGFFNAGVLRRGASRSAMSFMRAPTRTSTPKSSPRSPPNLGGSAAGAGGLSSHSAQPTSHAGHQTEQPTPSLPPS